MTAVICLVCHGDTVRKIKMIIYTRCLFNNPNINNVFTRKAYNLSLYNEIGILSGEKADKIMQTAEGHLQKSESILVAEISHADSFTFAIPDRNTSVVLQKLFDSIVAAIAENKSVYYVDDFYKANGL